MAMINEQGSMINGSREPTHAASRRRTGAVLRCWPFNVAPCAPTVTAPPCSVKQMGVLPRPAWPRVLTQLQLTHTVAPLGTLLGNWISAVVRVVMHWYW